MIMSQGKGVWTRRQGKKTVYCAAFRGEKLYAKSDRSSCVKNENEKAKPCDLTNRYVKCA